MNESTVNRRDILRLTAGGAACTVGLTRTIGAQESDSEPTFQWTFESGDERLTAWQTTADAVLASGSGTVYSIDLDTGDRRWSFDTSESYASVVTVLEELATAYVSARGTVYALTLDDGTERWSVDYGERYVSYPQTFDDENLVFVTTSSEAIALDGTDGSELWRVENSEARTFSGRMLDAEWADIEESIALIAGADIRAVDPATGAERWRRNFGQHPSVTSPADGISGVRTDSPTVHGVDITTGDELWTFDTGSDGRPRYVSSGSDSLYVIDSGTTLSIDMTTGEERWRFEHDSGNQVSCQEIHGRTYITAPSAVYAVDAATGEKLWTFETETDTARTTRVSSSLRDKTISLSDGGVVFRIDAATGEPEWSFDTGTETGSFALVDLPFIEAGGTLSRLSLPDGVDTDEQSTANDGADGGGSDETDSSSDTDSEDDQPTGDGEQNDSQTQETNSTADGSDETTEESSPDGREDSARPIGLVAGVVALLGLGGILARRLNDDEDDESNSFE